MLLNYAIESVRRLRERERPGPSHEKGARNRVPLVCVPSMFGTRLRDRSGRAIWGYTRSLFLGRSAPDTEDLRLDGLLEGFRLVPGLYSRDVYGGLLRYLQVVGGYRLGTDLFVLEYDWRKGIVFAARCLAALLKEIEGGSGRRVDLLCMSSGGLVARYYLARGGTPLEGASEGPSEKVADTVRHVVYLGTPHRGTLQAAVVLRDGFRLVPFGRFFAPATLARCQIAFDLLPHPADPAFVDPSGADIAWDLYDARAWTESGLSGCAGPDFQARLDRARRLHGAIGAAAAHPRATIIAARNIATRNRLVLDRGRALVPDCCSEEYKGRRPYFAPGDGSVPETSAIALPGHDPARVSYAEPSDHRNLPSDFGARKLVLEALLAGERADALSG